MSDPSRTLLKARSLRYTQPRATILAVLLERQVALSERDLEAAIGEACDRATIYRTLATFLDNGILHKVLDDKGSIKYALCTHDCQEEAPHHHDHVHFKCERCGDTQCLDHIAVPRVELPQGFVLKEVNTLFQGVCPNCNQTLQSN